MFRFYHMVLEESGRDGHVHVELLAAKGTTRAARVLIGFVQWCLTVLDSTSGGLFRIEDHVHIACILGCDC